jgi:DNA-binding MarR family transcriptional regulator
MPPDMPGAAAQRPTPDPDRRRLANHMAVMLPRFGHWISNVQEFETPYGHVGRRQIEVLWALRHNEIDDATPSRIAEHFGIQPSVMTRVLARLEGHGLVDRTPDPADGRRSTVRITERGLRTSEFVEDLFTQEMLDSMATLSDAQIDQLRACIAMLDEVADHLLDQRQRRTSGAG